MNTAPSPVPPTYPTGPYVPQEMPKAVKTARIALFVGAGLNIVIGLFLIVLTVVGPTVDETGDAGLTSGAFLLVGLISVLTGVACLLVGLKFRTGGSGVRTAAIVIAALTGASALFGLISGDGASGPSFVFTAIVLSCCLKKESAAWFARPRA
ncbi:hypothetical protein ACIA8F_00085 [Streptomyces sp. NPDC051563]|uniref:hypothetical protein n=1 Tax=Streptomyces sp. NPDC051563 TaxID=3365659 RepID=UPI0037AF4E1F